MGLVALWNFNEDDAATVHDYSTNAGHSTATAGLTIQNSAIGKEGVFDGTTTEIGLPAIQVAWAAFPAFSISARINSDVKAAKRTIMAKIGAIDFYLDSNAVLTATLTTSAGSATVSEATYTDSAYHDVMVAWDGADLKLYLDGSEVDTAALAGTNINNSNIFTIGYNSASTDYFDGKIVEVRLYNKNIGLTGHENLVATEQGVKYRILDGREPDVQVGDLMIFELGSTDERKAVITVIESASIVRIVAFGANRVTAGYSLQKIGNAFDTARQEGALFIGDSVNPRIEFYSGVTSFTLGTPVLSIDASGIQLPNGTASSQTYILNGDTDTVVNVNSGTYQDEFMVVIDAATVNSSVGKVLVNVTDAVPNIDFRVQEDGVTKGETLGISVEGIAEVAVTGLSLTSNRTIKLQSRRSSGGGTAVYDSVTFHHGTTA